MKIAKSTLIAAVVGIPLIAVGVLYLVKFLTNLPTEASFKELLSEGIALCEKGEYAEGAAKLEECYEKTSDEGLQNQALLHLSRCYTAQKDTEKAVESWNKILGSAAMTDRHSEAHYSLGLLLSGGEEPEKREVVKEHYEKAISSGPGTRSGDLAEVALARMMLEAGNPRGAQEALDKVRARGKDYPELKAATFELNMRMLFSPIMTEVPASDYYVVKEGDSLDRISKTLGTTTELLQESNGITDPRRLQIGKRIKVVTDKFRVEVSKSKKTLRLMSGETVLNEYPVGTGKFGSTPTGTFRISDRVKEPPWFRDGRVIPYGDPQNILGTRWMALQSTDGQKELTGYGIHGTDDDSSIGKESSQGCIRLRNRDVEELFKILPVGTEVVIED